MTVNEIMAELESKGSGNTVKIFRNHGARDPLFGCKVSDLKQILKRTKKNQPLAEQLWLTGNSDAMYLAGLMADENLISKETLESWVKDAYWYMLAEYAVAGVAAETPYALELARKWMESGDEMTACAGWAVYSGYLGIASPEGIDNNEVERLLERAAAEVHQAPNRVRYNMNNFLISAGTYVSELFDQAVAAAERVGKAGKVKVDMGSTACKVPDAVSYLKKVQSMGRVGKKRKKVRC